MLPGIHANAAHVEGPAPMVARAAERIQMPQSYRIIINIEIDKVLDHNISSVNKLADEIKLILSDQHERLKKGPHNRQLIDQSHNLKANMQ